MLDALGIVRRYRDLCVALDSAQGSSRGEEITIPLPGRCRGRKCKAKYPVRNRDGIGFRCARCGNPWPTETVVEFHGERRLSPPREQQILMRVTISCALRDLAHNDKRAAIVLAAYADAENLAAYSREHTAARLIRVLSNGWAPEKRERMQALARADEYLQERLGNHIEKHT